MAVVPTTQIAKGPLVIKPFQLMSLWSSDAVMDGTAGLYTGIVGVGRNHIEGMELSR